MAISLASGDPAEERIVHGLLRIGTVLKSHAWQYAIHCGLTPTQAQIVSLLHNRPGTLNLTTLAKELGVKPATASDSVNTLVKKGQVTKKRLATGDRRLIALQLTDSGRALAEQIAGWPDCLDEAVATLSPSERHALLRCLLKMLHTLQIRKQIPAGRMCSNCRHFRANIYPGQSAPHHCQAVDRAFGDGDLQFDCSSFQEASTAEINRNWVAYLERAGPESGTPISG